MAEKITDRKPQEGKNKPVNKEFKLFFPIYGKDGAVQLGVASLNPQQLNDLTDAQPKVQVQNE